MSPIQWGATFHFLIHSIAFALMMHAEFTPENLQLWADFLFALASYLPCWVCSNHFRAHLAEHPPLEDIHSWNDVWQWTVDFHNAVNERTGKRIYSEKEAREALLKQAGYPTDWSHVFSFKFWSALTITSQTFTDKDGVGNEEQQETYVNFLDLVFQLIPFGRFVHNDTLVSDILRQKLSEQKWDTVANAANSICNLYNEVAPLFNAVPLSAQQWFEMYKKNFLELETIHYIERANMQRLEDHEVIKTLQNELHQLRAQSHQGYLARTGLAERTADGDLSSFEIVSIVIISLLLLILLIFVWRYYYQNRRRRRKKTLFAYEPMDPFKIIDQS